MMWAGTPIWCRDLGHRQLVAVHTGGQMVLFLPHSHFDHAAGEDIFIKRLDEIVGKAFVQQLLNHFLTLERAGHEERGVPLPRRIVLLFDGQRIQSRHECVQQHHLRPHREHFLKYLLSVFLDDRNFHAFLFQRFAASLRDLRTGIRHQKPNFFHRSFLQSVQFS